MGIFTQPYTDYTGVHLPYRRISKESSTRLVPLLTPVTAMSSPSGPWEDLPGYTLKQKF